MPVYDKPMIYYPLTTLILAGVRDILIITTPSDRLSFERLLGDGTNFGLRLSYREQSQPRGLAEAFLIGEEHIAGENCVLILGDNLFYGTGLGSQLTKLKDRDGATIFGYRVANPSAYGVVTFDDDGRAVSLDEKPDAPRSKYAVPGLYFYDSRVVALARQLKPSARGELEITDINRLYMELGALNVQILPRGSAWLDTGTFDDLSDASSFVRAVEARQGMKIGCPEEAAWRNGWVSDEQLLRAADQLSRSGYGQYLRSLIEEA